MTAFYYKNVLPHNFTSYSYWIRKLQVEWQEVREPMKNQFEWGSHVDLLLSRSFSHKTEIWKISRDEISTGLRCRKLIKKLRNDKDLKFYLYLAGYSPYPESINFNRFMFSPSGSSRYKRHLA